MKLEFATDKAVEYAWFGENCLKLESFGTKAIADGAIIIICKFTPEKATLITLEGNFLTHPRSGGIRLIPYVNNQMEQFYAAGVYGGGYRQSKDGKGYTEIENRYLYPLQDDDKGTWSIEAPVPLAELSSSENYGDCWWSDGSLVLSWKGAPNRHWNIGADINIAGVSRLERETANTQYFTTFGNSVYKNGEILYTFAPEAETGSLNTLVVGACQYSGVNIAITVTLKSGYWLQLWQIDTEAVEIGNGVRASRPETPCFINSTGNFFVYEKSLYKINDSVDGFTEIEVVPVADNGFRTVTGRGGYGSTYEYKSGSLNLWPSLDPTGKLLYSNAFVKSAFFDYKSTGDTDVKTKEVPVYRGNPATGITITMEPSGTVACGGDSIGTNYYATFTASVNGDYCSVEWSGATCSNGLSAIKIMPDCNIDFTVTATIQPQGISASYTHTANPLAIVVTGDATGTVGSQYSATNASEPLTWSITNGAIDETGTITSLTGCTPVTVSVSDACERTGSKTLNNAPAVPTISFANLDATYGALKTTAPASTITVSGGVGDLSMSATNISTSKNGNVYTVTSISCPGTLQPAKSVITVTDACGTEATAEVKITGGRWNNYYVGGSGVAPGDNYFYVSSFDGIAETTANYILCRTQNAALIDASAAANYKKSVTSYYLTNVYYSPNVNGSPATESNLISSDWCKYVPGTGCSGYSDCGYFAFTRNVYSTYLYKWECT